MEQNAEKMRILRILEEKVLEKDIKLEQSLKHCLKLKINYFPSLQNLKQK